MLNCGAAGVDKVSVVAKALSVARKQPWASGKLQD